MLLVAFAVGGDDVGHVAVLEDARLVRRQVRGRERWPSARPDGLRAAGSWIAGQTAFWSTRADALAAHLERKQHPR